MERRKRTGKESECLCESHHLHKLSVILMTLTSVCVCVWVCIILDYPEVMQSGTGSSLFYNSVHSSCQSEVSQALDWDPKQVASFTGGFPLDWCKRIWIDILCECETDKLQSKKQLVKSEQKLIFIAYQWLKDQWTTVKLLFLWTFIVLCTYKLYSVNVLPE